VSSGNKRPPLFSPKNGKRFQPPKGAARFKDVLPASRAIANALKLHGIADEVRAERLVTEWTDLVGAKIASKTRAHGIAERVLIIEVVTSAWMHELNMLKPRLLAGLLERFGQPALFEDIRFRLAGSSRTKPTLVPPPRTKPTYVPPAVAPASGAAREQIVKEVEVVDDQELRELITRVRITNDR
jgi:predicted nucleic acid-binding Zn ribbon protein